jgi:hypothetical protein
MNVISILVVIGVIRGQNSLGLYDALFGPYPKVAVVLIFVFFDVLHWLTLRPSTYKKPTNPEHRRWPLLLYPFVSLAICYSLLFAFGHPYRGRAQ